MPFRRRKPESPGLLLGALSAGVSGAGLLSSSHNSLSASLLEYSEFHDSNTLDAQLGPRLRALQDSLRNPELSPSVRNILQTAYTQFERESARTQELLPAYTPDHRPPYH